MFFGNGSRSILDAKCYKYIHELSQQVGRADSGDYTCRATNDRGSREKNLKIQVECEWSIKKYVSDTLLLEDSLLIYGHKGE